ncbi:hypothetical protein BGZ60DRAFT_523095 [Tricladium varicosporioides]|nr:hypothetical protein BGZ60DRAFT_523095 [Hymenoscyphus varicosporioides]
MSDRFEQAATNLWDVSDLLSTSEAREMQFSYDYPLPLGPSKASDFHHSFKLPTFTHASTFKAEENEDCLLETDRFGSMQDMYAILPVPTIDSEPTSQSSIYPSLLDFPPLSTKSPQNTKFNVARDERQRFACAEVTCSKSFKRRFDLMRHERSAHSLHTFTCPKEDCYQHVHGFVRRHMLSRHMKEVHHDLSQSTILPPLSMSMEIDTVYDNIYQVPSPQTHGYHSRAVSPALPIQNDARSSQNSEQVWDIDTAGDLEGVEYTAKRDKNLLQEKLLELIKVRTELDREISALERVVDVLRPDMETSDGHRDHRDGRHIVLGDCRLEERPKTTSESELHSPLSISQSNNKPGKLSPYSTPSQEDETSSDCGLDTEHSEDDDSSVESDRSSFLVLNHCWRRQKLFAEVMRAFWNDYNKNSSAIIASCIAPKTNTPNSQGHSTNTSRPHSSTLGLASSPMINSSSRKRAISGDRAPPDNNDESPKRQKGKSTDLSSNDPRIKFACPFRKYNPTKYNIHQHKTCALRGFVSIHRTKEHVYRHHKKKIQCVRCWLYFKCQNDLDIHLDVENICERQPGKTVDGMTPDMEKELRSRKKSPENQNDEDCWASMYRVLFPGAEGVPSPYFELVQDNVAQARTVGLQPIEEYVRQQAPQVFMESLRMEIIETCDPFFLDDQGRIQFRNEFVSRLGTLTSVAVGTAIGSYRQMEFNLGSGHGSIIPHLSIDGSSSTPQAPFIQTPPEFGNFSSQQQAYSQSSQDLQSFTRPSVFGNNDVSGYYIQPADDIGKEDVSSSSQTLVDQLPISHYATSFEG